MIYPKKFARTPVSMIIGPAIAVSPPINPRIALTGPGKFPINFKIPSIAFNTNAPTFKNCSPTTASSAFTDSSALLYLPDADSVSAVNSRAEIAAKSCVLAFIRSRT